MEKQADDKAKRGYAVDNNTYVQILIDTLTKKNNLLEHLLQITSLQEEYITAIPLDMEQFEQAITKKELLIERLNQLDDGFDKVYDHVKDEIDKNKNKYKNDIEKLQELIKQVTENSVKLQAIEKQNKNKLEVYFSGKKKEIKNFKLNSQTASNYYKNMANQNQGQSYFLDKKN